MRKRYVSDDELNQVIKLKQAGASWLMIQNQSGVPRRSARQAYEEWQRSQSIDELKSARVGVAAEEFRKHVDLTIKIAELLAGGLKAPETPRMTINADELLYSLWEKSYREIKNYQPDKTIETRERQRFIREYQMLLKSLQYHTQEKVHWEVLEDWKQAWNSSISHLKRLEKEANSIAENITKTDASLFESINSKSGQDKVEVRLAQTVLNVIWQNIVDDTLNTENPEIYFSYELLDKNFPIPMDKDLFEKIAEILRQVAEAFCAERKKNIMQPLMNDAYRMSATINTLEEMLNPLVLRPLILRTRCDLCPA